VGGGSGVTIIFLANFACFVGFMLQLNRKISVQRHGVCIIICCYTDVHARPEASSDMSVLTITAGDYCL